MSENFSLENDNDGMGTTLADTFAGLIGVFVICGMLVIVNLGVKAVQSVRRNDLESLVTELENDRQKAAQRIQNALDELNAERSKDAAERKQRGEGAEKFAEYTKGMQQQIGQLKNGLDKAKGEADAANDRARNAEGQIASLRDARRLRILFVVDISRSMADGISEIRHTLTAMSQTMPAALTSFEVGVIAYREDDLKTFELRQLDRDGSGLDDLESFLGGLEAVTGKTCIDVALEAAIATLERSENTGSDVIVLTADVGPGDIDPGYDAAAGDAVVRSVERWAAAAPDGRRFLSFLTSPNVPHPRYDAHRPFFERLGRVSPGSQFSTRLSSMFPIVFDAAFPKD